MDTTRPRPLAEQRLDGPPPPPAPAGGAGESRATAATWVATVGAVLLLAAATTFLAVSWDGLGLTARVAIVASATAAAVVGGHRLRRVLPAVGAVVFHLGALLIPIDALGLASQLDAEVATRWWVVGLTGVTVLPLLAVVGRSRVLGVAGVVAVPVLATGVGMAGWVPPAAVLVTVAGILLAVERSSLAGRVPTALRTTARVAGPALAAGAVIGPASASVLVRLVPTTAAVEALHFAGWLSPGWDVTAAVGVAAVTVLAVIASRRRAPWLAGLTSVTAAVAAGATVLPPDTPRPAVLVVPALVWLLVEGAAALGRADELWGRPTRALALAAEVVAGIVGLQVLAVALLNAVVETGDPDGAWALRSAVLAAAWTVAALRRSDPARPAGASSVLLGTVALTHLAAALQEAGAGADVVGGALAVGAVATLLVLVERRGRPRGAVDPASDRTDPVGVLTGSGARRAAPFAAVALLGLTIALAGSRPWLVALTVVAPAVLGAHLATTTRGDDRVVAPVVGGGVAAAAALLGVLAFVLEVTSPLPSGVGVLLATGSLLAMAACIDRVPPVADTLRALALAAGLVLLTPGLVGGLPVTGGDLAALRAAAAIGVLPAALVPAGVIATWLALDAVRTRRSVVAALAAPVALRAVAAALLAAGVPVGTAGTVLLGLGLLAAIAAALGPRWVLAPAATAALVGGIGGWVLVGDAPLLRAATVAATGIVIAAVGTARRRPVVAHLGGFLATLGAWNALAIAEVGALDLWLLPVALHLAVAGEVARRWTATSSWVAFVPSILLVAVPGLGERLAGGAGWHAVLTGAVGVLAVVLGGARRLGGPLVVGTGVVLATVAVETLAVVAAVPTWVWLGLGGATLLAAAAVIERTGSPVRSVRRAAEVVGERFD